MKTVQIPRPDGGPDRQITLPYAASTAPDRRTFCILLELVDASQVPAWMPEMFPDELFVRTTKVLRNKVIGANDVEQNCRLYSRNQFLCDMGHALDLFVHPITIDEFNQVRAEVLAALTE